MKRYLERHHVDYPVLIAGLPDKKVASDSLPFLDQVRSYPTTIFLDSNHKVVSVHHPNCRARHGTGHEEMKYKFEERIDSIIDDDR